MLWCLGPQVCPMYTVNREESHNDTHFCKLILVTASSPPFRIPSLELSDGVQGSKQCSQVTAHEWTLRRGKICGRFCKLTLITASSSTFSLHRVSPGNGREILRMDTSSWPDQFKDALDHQAAKHKVVQGDDLRIGRGIFPASALPTQNLPWIMSQIWGIDKCKTLFTFSETLVTAVPSLMQWW